MESNQQTTHLTAEQFDRGITQIKNGFEDIQSFIDVLKNDLTSTDDATQKSAIFVSVELIKTVYKFREQVQILSETKRTVMLPQHKQGLYIPKGARKKWK